MLAHKATHQGKVAAEVCAGRAATFDAMGIPSVAYTIPEVAWVGLTETAAKENNSALGPKIGSAHPGSYSFISSDIQVFTDSFIGLGRLPFPYTKFIQSVRPRWRK